MRSRSMGEGRLLGQAGRVGESPGQKGCSLSVVMSLVILFMYAHENPMDILTCVYP